MRVRSALGLALPLLVVCFPASAAASVAALERREAASATDSVGFKGAIPSCTAGKKVLGTGVNPTSNGQLALKTVRPNAALTNVTVQASEDEDGFAGNWQVVGYAQCAVPPAGLERIAVTSAGTSANKTVTATCSPGKQVTGVGGDITGGGGQVALDDLQPNPAMTDVTVQGVEDEDGTTDSWSVTAYAICSFPVEGLERVLAKTGSTSATKSVTVACPPGKQVLGAGGLLSGGAGRLLSTVSTGTAMTHVTVRGIEDDDGTATSWLARAFAICANTAVRVFNTTATNSAASKSTSATCPAGKVQTGGGGEITGGGGQVRFDQPGGAGSALGMEDGNGTSALWYARAFSICHTALAGREALLASGALNSTNPKSTLRACPDGKLLTNAAAASYDANGTSFGNHIILDDITPNPALTGMFATAFEDESGTAASWRVNAYAICATPPPGLELVAAQSSETSPPSNSATATCPLGKTLLGTGADLSGAIGEVVIEDIRPDVLLRSVTATAAEDETGVTSEWFVRALAICADA